MASAIKRFPELCYNPCILHEHQLFLESIAETWKRVSCLLLSRSPHGGQSSISAPPLRSGVAQTPDSGEPVLCFFNSFQTWQRSAYLGMNLGEGEDLVNEIVVSFSVNETYKGFKLFPYQKGTAWPYLSCRYIICLRCSLNVVWHSSRGGDSHAMLCQWAQHPQVTLCSLHIWHVAWRCPRLSMISNLPRGIKCWFTMCWSKWLLGPHSSSLCSSFAYLPFRFLMQTY